MDINVNVVDDTNINVSFDQNQISVPEASTSNYGTVKLSDSIVDDSTTVPTTKAVYNVTLSSSSAITTHINDTTKHLSVEQYNALQFDPNSKNLYLRKDGVFAQVPIGGGGSGVLIYLSDTNSDITGYKKLTLVPDVNEVIKTITANNGTVYGETYIFDLPIDIDTINAGSWIFDYWRSVSNISQDSYARLESFLRHSDGSETTIYSVESSSIEDTVLSQRSISYTLQQFSVLPTDRFGIKISFRTTRSSDTIYSYVVGGQRGHSIATPIPPRHDYLRDKNGNLDYQHLNNSERFEGGLATGNTTLNTVKKVADKAETSVPFKIVTKYEDIPALTGLNLILVTQDETNDNYPTFYFYDGGKLNWIITQEA